MQPVQASQAANARPPLPDTDLPVTVELEYLPAPHRAQAVGEFDTGSTFDSLST